MLFVYLQWQWSAEVEAGKRSVRRPVVLLGRRCSPFLRLSLAAASAQRYAPVDLEMKSEGREKYKDSIVKTMGKVRSKDLRS